MVGARKKPKPPETLGECQDTNLKKPGVTTQKASYNRHNLRVTVSCQPSPSIHHLEVNLAKLGDHYLTLEKVNNPGKIMILGAATKTYPPITMRKDNRARL